jgi:hypothetical protein
MDISNIPQTLAKALEQKNTTQLVALSRVLNLVLGKTEMATVTSTEPVTEPERAALLKQTAAALAQVKQQASNNLTPAVKAEIARLVQQQNLIQSPELKWINLVVNNRPLLTYSDKPLATGQSVPVQLQSPQKLVLVDSPALEQPASKPGAISQAALAATLSAPSAALKNAAMLNELLKTTITELAAKTLATATASSTSPIKNPLASNTTTPIAQDPNSKTALLAKMINYSTNELSLKYSVETNNKTPTPETLAAKNIVSENLRNLLPHKDTPNSLFSAINQLQQLPAASRLQLFSPSVEQALKSIAEKIRSPEQLAQPKILAQTFKNSGVFFEKKLTEGVQKNNDEITGSSKAALNATYTQDLKGSLLTLLSRVTQEINGDKKPLSSEQTIKLLQGLSNPALFHLPGAAITNPLRVDIAHAIGMFVQQLMHKPVKELSDKELRTQLLVLLQRHSVHSLARIQLQQLHSLNHELDTKDSSTPNASWQMEIPVKQHNDIHHLHMRIDREWIDEKSESDTNKSTNKIKQWSVTLRFDLPTLGEFCAQLAIVNNQVSATLWAAREKTFGEVRDHIEGLRKQLESEGIDVKYLQCMHGMPPEKPLALSYSLIDIST